MSHAQLKNVSENTEALGIPKLSMTRDKGGMRITSEPIKVNIDTYESRKSAGIMSPLDANKMATDKTISIVYQATARYAQEGDYLSETPTAENPIPELAKNYFNRNIETMLGFIPSVKPNITWKDGMLNIQYDADELDFDWDLARPNFEFIPPNIEITVLERPTVMIEYLGGPIYVPPSSDPNYEPTSLDLQV